MELLTRKSFKYRIYPTKSQENTMENQFSMCRYLYNWNLAERIEAYQEDGTTISYNQQQNKLPTLKEERPWFKSVHSQVLQDVLRRLDNGYQAFFRRVKNGEAPGFPKFKKRGQWDSITFPQYHKRPTDSFIPVSKVGKVKIVYHRDIPEEAIIKVLTIIKEAGKWFACFSIEIPITIEPKQAQLPPIGIDMGLIDFYYTSDGSQEPVPQYLRKKEKQLQRLQRRLSKAPKGTKKYLKLLKALQKCHYRIKCQRNDFLHKKANQLLDASDTIFHEKLNVRNMIRRPKPKMDEETGKYLPNNASAKAGLNKSIADAGWSRFFGILQYKGKELCKQIISVPPQYTSQTCSSCGEIVKKSLSTRTHRCECGFVANRDHNAALNILRIGMDTLQAST